MNWMYRYFPLFLLLTENIVSFSDDDSDETYDFFDYKPTNLVVDQTSKNKVEHLGSVLKKHIRLLRGAANKKVDLVFLIDSSASVGRVDFQNEVKFVRKLLSDFTVDNNHTKISVITFSSKRSVLRQIDYIGPNGRDSNKCTLIDKDLPKITYKGGGTYTLGAFKEAKKVLEHAREDASKAIFLITDGFSNGGDPKPEARRIRQSGVKIFTVGIAKGNKEELWDMSSEPKNETSYILDSFEEFESLARRALHEDLGRGDFILQPEDKCDDLCFKGYDCCDEKASCKCGTYTGTYECICKPGYYGTGLLGSCKPCPPGTYKSTPSPGDVSTCTRCPDENHTTFKGSTDLSKCVCKKGFRDFNNTGCVALRCPVLAAPKNGYFVNDRCDNVFNAACGIRCKPGYYLKGSGLRICQEGGSWNGRTTECIMKTCPALPRPKNGNMICDRDGFSFSTVCRFTCDTGYKLVGSRKRECLAISAWTGINTRCREITCRPLPFVKDGKVFPSACTKDDVPFGTTCQISCYHGYSIVGPPIKQCTPEGMWVPSADGEMTHCDDTSPPVMKCPPNIITEADADDSSVEVNWLPPIALDNSGIRPIVTVIPAIEPPKHFPIGLTKVKYVAEDLSGNKVKCTFTVHVKDVTPPLADRCVSPFPLVTSEKYANVTWDEPEFSDNSGVITRVERNIAQGLFPQGKTEVVYTAFDESGNNNTCVINVNVLPHPCQYPPPPVNGERNCFETDEGVHCKVYCKEGYAFAIPPAEDYFCAYDHKWRPADKLPIPDCSVETSTNSVIQPASVTYIGEIPCGKQVLVNEIETVFQEKVKEKVASICGNNIVCEVDNIQTTCVEDDSNFNKIKLVFNNKNKRSIRHRRRMRRAPKTRYSLRFDFTVKGERKKSKKIIENLESSMERILGDVKVGAKGGNMDLEMDGKTMMQFANISYDSDEHQFECEPGSILVNTSCIKCPVGTMYNAEDGECRGCPKGLYQPKEGQFTCLECPEYTSTHSSNSKSINDCKDLCSPGTYSKDGLEQCTTCVEGSYQNKHGQMTCLSCPNDTTTYSRGVRRLSMCRAKCSAGYVSKTGLEPCSPCPKGTYQSKSGQIFCLECPGGGETTHLGTTDVIDCEGRWDFQSDVADEVSYSECFGNECQNGATCQSRGGFGFDCICAPGFTGVYCERELDECEAEPCLNGGTCVDLKTGYSCKCADGFTGTKCEMNIDECIDQPCVNNGTCVDEINGFNCSCPPAYEGEKCERLKDDCVSANCRHNGTCVNTVQGYTCQCVNGYTGADCEINDDDCSSGPCVNNGQCVDKVAGYSCQCPPGYTGNQCESDIDECSSSPCYKDATCVNQIDSYKCVCPSGFSGQTCDTELDGDYKLDFPTAGTVDYAAFSMDKDLTAFTISFWIKTTDDVNQGTPFSYSVGSYDNALTMTNYDGFVIYVNNKMINTDIKANDGTWHNILFTWASNRGAWKIYKNAFLWDQGYNLAAGETIKGGGRVVIGQEQDVGGVFSQPESFVGSLTNLNLWSGELTYSQVEKMIINCDKYVGDVIAWPDVQSNLQGDLHPTPSGFCRACPEPSKPMYGQISFSGTNANDSVTYKCQRGYDLIGDQIRKCLVTSQWQNTEPECRLIDCQYPGYLLNGVLIGRNFKFDNRVRYKCNHGYILVGNETQYCNEHGEWEGDQPKCQEITCDLPILSENTLVADLKQSYRPGDEAIFKCSPGNRLLTTHDSVLCQRDGTWDRSVPTCDPQKCKAPPNIQNGRTDVTGDEFSVGFMVHYTCELGYKFSKSSSNSKGVINCLPTGEWESSLPQCTGVTCSKPPTVANARSIYDSVAYLGTVEYVCNPGYILYGQSILECLEDGLWDPDSPQCDPVDCGHVTSPLNTIVTTSGTTYGSRLTYECNTGYIINGISNSVCLENGSWSGSPPSCLPVSCGRPENIAHGSFTETGFLFMNTVTYICNPGYEFEGISTRDCTSTGAWTSDIPKCLKIKCSTPPNIDNGYYTETSFSFEDTVSYKCETGYLIQGNSSIQCQSNRQWSALQFTCEPVLCPILTASVGINVEVTGQTFRSQATYSCKEGYTLIGETIRICQPEGYWSARAPVCNPVSCPLLKRPNNGDLNITGQTFESMAFYYCDSGYKMTGINQRTCQADGYWSGVTPFCEQVLCPVLSTVYGGGINVTNHTIDSIATYSCNDGYYMIGEDIRICQQEGSWSGKAPTCNIILCPILDVPEGGQVTTSNQTVGSVATYSCNDGYTLQGESIRLCQPQGNWSGVAPTCQLVKCPVLDIPGGGNVSTTGQSVGSMATYSCNVGYRTVGETIRVCQPEGHWSGRALICEVVLCPVLVSPNAGGVRTTGETFNSVAIYLCSEGYTLNGVKIQTCQADGTWSNIPPLCELITCPTLSSPDNGLLVISGQTFNSTAIFTCNAGYNITGKNVLKCQSNGDWSSSIPFCLPVSCPVLDVPENGNVVATGLIFGSVATYSCNTGYMMFGTDSRNCQANGIWSDDTPSCNVVLCPILEEINGGSIVVTGQTFRSVATYYCNDGYTMDGESIRICQPDGSWSVRAPTCIPTTCLPPADISNGQINYKDLHVESVALYICDEGFQLVGDDVRRCLNDLTWSGSQPSCIAITCPRLPQLTNGQQATTGLAFNSVASFECDRGFQLNGVDELVCTATGQWSASFPSCTTIECETPARVISNGRMVGDAFTYDSVISYICDRGYNLTGSVNRTCMETGEWNEPIPVCEIVRCSLPRLAHGSASTFQNEYNTRVMFSCASGYIQFGSLERICLANGSWSGSDTICVKCNNPPNLQNGVVDIDNEIATYNCKKGHYLVGNSKLECQIDGSWVNEMPVCIPLECEDLEDENILNGNRSMSGYLFGDLANYTCNEGYRLLGSEQRQCLENGYWSGLPPVCVIVQCPGTFEIINGRITGNNSYGSSLTFTCNDGFQLVGQSTLKCLATGSWSRTAPFCEEILCERLPLIRYGSVSYTSTGLSVGSKAAYSCDQLYELIGDPIRECLNTTEWSGTEPTCVKLECPSPNPIAHGSVTTSGRTPGRMANYQCDEGYSLQGLRFRICNYHKIWSGVDPTCVPIACQSPSPILHGQIVNGKNESTFGDIIQYKCDEGYRLFGDDIRTCTSDGRWSNIAPTCNIVSCGPPKEINNAVISNLQDPSFSFGSTLSIECNNGYTSLSGQSVISECTKDGIWSISFLECFKTRCPPLSALENGRMVGSGFSYNDVLTFSCNEGFVLRGPSRLTCQSNKRWSSEEPPSCEVITCQLPQQISNGMFLGNNYTFGNNITYQCNIGYTLVGHRTRTCERNAMWSGIKPVCSVVMCPLSDSIPNGQWNTSDVSLPYSAVIGVNCNRGYIRSANYTFVCSESGRWVGGSLSCSIVHCPIPNNPLNGRVLYSAVTYNSEIQYGCDDGYQLSGIDRLLCLETGSWDNTAPICTPVSCGVPEFVQYSDVVGDNYLFGNTVTYICRQGYEAVGSTIRTCLSNGQWSGSMPICHPVRCDQPPVVSNGMFIGTNFTYQSTVIYQCHKGYKITGTSSLTCGLNRQWLGDHPQCEIVSCGHPPVVLFSTTTVTGFTFGDTVSYGCNPGYILTGDSIAMCQETGLWSTSNSTLCLPIDCGKPVDIPNGIAQYISTTYLSSMSYSCNETYSLIGGSTLVCSTNGLWEGLLPSCVHTTCGPPAITNNVRVVGGGNYSIGETLTYVCPEGHILVGNTTTRCQETGRWSSATPECFYVSCGSISHMTNALKIIGIQHRNYQYEDVVHFECEDGYILQGESRSVCLSNGTWSSAVPVCHPEARAITELFCPLSTLTTDSRRIDSQIPTGGSVVVQCITGYKGEGNMTAMCSYSQTWTVPVGHCRRIHCGKPAITDMVNVVRVSGRSYFYNDHVQYRCRPGIRPAKYPPIIRCTESGLWDGEIACSLPCKGGCFNGGRCFGLYGCKCPPGFGGRRCEKAYCILPCLNGGTCISPYLCSCLPGYNGTRCESPICDRPCQFGGVCIKPNMCHCKHGFKKPFCDYPDERILPNILEPVNLQPSTPPTELPNVIDVRLIHENNRETITQTTTARPTTSIRKLLIPSTTPEKPDNTRPTTGRPATSTRKLLVTSTTPGEPDNTRPTTRRPAYLDYIDYDFKVPDPS